MTRFSNFTDEELDVMESAFCEEGLRHLVDEVRMESRYRHRIKRRRMRRIKDEEENDGHKLV